MSEQQAGNEYRERCSCQGNEDQVSGWELGEECGQRCDQEKESPGIWLTSIPHRLPHSWILLGVDRLLFQQTAMFRLSSDVDFFLLFFMCHDPFPSDQIFLSVVLANKERSEGKSGALSILLLWPEGGSAGNDGHRNAWDIYWEDQLSLGFEAKRRSKRGGEWIASRG